MSTFEERRDQRFHAHTVTALKDIEGRGMPLPIEQGYAAAYGILRRYFEIGILVNFADAFSSEQLAEIRIVLDQLTKLVQEDTHLDSATRAKLDELARLLRESEQYEERTATIENIATSVDDKDIDAWLESEQAT